LVVAHILGLILDLLKPPHILLQRLLHLGLIEAFRVAIHHEPTLIPLPRATFDRFGENDVWVGGLPFLEAGEETRTDGEALGAGLFEGWGGRGDVDDVVRG